MKISGIYQIQSKIKPERVYVGSAVNISNRWNLHLWLLINNRHHSKKLQRHYIKYGESDLVFSILLGCDREDLIKTEQYFIDSYNPYFNGCKTAGNCFGYKHTDETKLKHRIAKLGKKRTAESVKKTADGNRGQKRTESQKIKMGNARRGIKVPAFTEEHKRKIGAGNKGKYVTLETRAKQSESHKGKKFTEKHKINHRNAMIGHVVSEETRRKIGMANKIRLTGRKHSEETKAKMSQARRNNILKQIQNN